MFLNDKIKLTSELGVKTVINYISSVDLFTLALVNAEKTEDKIDNMFNRKWKLYKCIFEKKSIERWHF